MPGTGHKIRSEFALLVCQRYCAMQQRVNKSRYANGRVIPFGHSDLKAFLADKLGGEDGHTRCEYCAAPVSIQTVRLDHRRPLAQGGELGLSNIALSCECCNFQKGEMNPVAFTALLKLVNDPRLFNHVDRTDCLGRLQSSLKLALLYRRRLARAQPAREPASRVVPHVRTPPSAS